MMKQKNGLLIALLIMLMVAVFSTMALTAFAEGDTPTDEQTTVEDGSSDGDTDEEEPVEPPFTGIKDGKYYADDVLQTSGYAWSGNKFYKISTNGTVVLFTGSYSGRFYKNGAYTNGWQTIGKNTYYCSNGTPLKGRRYISKKWYYFKSNGVQATGDVTENKVTYYINKNKNLEASKKGKYYYKPNGKRMSNVDRDDYITLRRARSVVKKVTNSKMTKSQKLKACFKWVMKHPYKRYRMPFPYKNKAWASLYANDHFVRKGGDCHADAAAFAYLARALGYKNVYICLDAKLKNPNHHAWTYVNGRYYDPLFAQSRSFSRYYAAKKMNLTAITKKKVAVGYVGDK